MQTNNIIRSLNLLTMICDLSRPFLAFLPGGGPFGSGGLKAFLSWEEKKYLQERCTLVDVKDAQKMALDPEAVLLSFSTSKPFVFDMEVRNDD